jgi:hypothetical protein
VDPQDVTKSEPSALVAGAGEHRQASEPTDSLTVAAGRATRLTAVVKGIRSDCHKAPEDYLTALDTRQQGE